MKHIQVFSKDLCQFMESTNTTLSFSHYQVHDLVHISSSEVGLVLSIEKDGLSVLLVNGSVSRYTFKQIDGKRDDKRFVASDMNGKPLTQGDSVDVRL